ncbi:hypothetical protein GCM10027026_19860 [Myroides odoratimimus subsp. xuanwuensis]
MSLLLRDVEVEGRRVDVRVVDGVVGEIGSLRPKPGEEVVDGRGGALLPGLHDHHLHLLSIAAARACVDVGDDLAALRGAPGAWVLSVNARESVDRHTLDALVPDRPVRVQHRSGGLWMLNSAALREVARVLDDSPDVERDELGEPTGRLWRYDARLRHALPSTAPDLTGVVDELHRLGVTSVTDAIPDLDPNAVRILSALPMPVTPPRRSRRRRPAQAAAPRPRPAVVRRPRGTIETTHAGGRAVAVHCVTRESLLLNLAVLDEVGRLPGDRIEHAAVMPEPALLRGLTDVTQPAFVTTRGADYIRNGSPHDLPHLYPFAGLLAAGVHVLASSDTPYGRSTRGRSSARPVTETWDPRSEPTRRPRSAATSPAGSGWAHRRASACSTRRWPTRSTTRTPRSCVASLTWSALEQRGSVDDRRSRVDPDHRRGREADRPVPRHPPVLRARRSHGAPRRALHLWAPSVRPERPAVDRHDHAPTRDGHADP